jgi:hypothetical protein
MKGATLWIPNDVLKSPGRRRISLVAVMGRSVWPETSEHAQLTRTHSAAINAKDRADLRSTIWSSLTKSEEKSSKGAQEEKNVWYDFGQCDSKWKSINQLRLNCLTSVAELTGKQHPAN